MGLKGWLLEMCYICICICAAETNEFLASLIVATMNEKLSNRMNTS